MSDRISLLVTMPRYLVSNIIRGDKEQQARWCIANYIMELYQLIWQKGWSLNDHISSLKKKKKRSQTWSDLFAINSKRFSFFITFFLFTPFI